jgi:hypothetical protein
MQDDSREDQDTKPQQLEAKNFVVNFLQTKAKLRSRVRDYTQRSKAKYPEAKQRAEVFAILNVSANGKLEFQQMWNLFK